MGVKRLVKRADTSEGEDIIILFSEFVEAKEAEGLSKATIKSYKKSFEKFVDFIGERHYTNDITNKTIYAFINDMEESGTVKTTSINHYLRDVRAYLYWLMEQELLDRFIIKEKKHQEERKETYTDEELEKLLKKPRRNDDFFVWRSWAIENWLYATGNRANSVLSITIDCLDFKHKRIIIPETKNKKIQEIPMSSTLMNVLKEYIRLWRTVDREGNIVSTDKPLFSNAAGEPLTYNALRLSISKYNKERGVERTSIHAFRHTFALDVIRRTGDVFRLQKLLGHSTLEMTKHYVNLLSEDLQEGFDNFNPLDNFKRKANRTKLIGKNE